VLGVSRIGLPLRVANRGPTFLERALSFAEHSLNKCLQVLLIRFFPQRGCKSCLRLVEFPANGMFEV
jgi:hypothetical protein